MATGNANATAISDQTHDQGHRRCQQCQVATQGPQRGLDRVRHRGHRIGHHRERERQQQDGTGMYQPSPGAGITLGNHARPL
jgi:hypothetical protein